ncbi:acetyltransferase [Fluoribacter dumoffii]|uniref:Bifunctional AAC/APH n=1 Tax=Fluoribacter dumoffii TaxID=463 RepID=A0A377G8Q4_9GAMM|nr:GNAT family N-acetyltransferase [Fluoribacter dumoffii]KTC90035.1 aminoglycoside 6'-N-acetyltransferase [Fluoribacter dumoffii NY 23]MCW8385333.1 acetyltransferase [Fluoribacter dumoffii]MCW8418387.1 acetyltransferase [Fluoribacter dumoffii]MCW8453771.1 acetyltransferase [Fluoribacter dumoffii]MCW8462158.1 acetyltransferase [Fluoribacter dumoffii]
MNQLNTLVFKPLSEQDFILLYRWFKEPFINQWYAGRKHWSLEDIRNKYYPRVSGKDKVPSFIVYKDNLPIGFIQYYELKDHFPEGILNSNNSLFCNYQSHELAGIDLFIASRGNRGIGLGKQILDAFIRKLPPDIRGILVDPAINNYQAIRCYEKAGFRPTVYSEDKRYLLLLKDLTK